MMNRAFWGRVAGVWLGVCLVASVLLFGFVRRGQHSMQKSDAAFDRGDLTRSLTHAREAASYYVPFAPHVEAAYQRMTAIALGAEAKGKTKLARWAWSNVRGALFETAHPAMSRGERLSTASQQLARLVQASDEHPERSPAETREPIEPFTRSPLAWDLPMLMGGGFLLMLGAVGWAASRHPDGGSSSAARRASERFLIGASFGLGLFFWLSAAMGS